MLLTPAAAHSHWLRQTASLNMNSTSLCQLSQNASLVQHFVPFEQDQGLQPGSSAKTQSNITEHAAPSTQKSGFSSQHGPECVSLKEKNRIAQRKFREKQKAKQSQAEDKASQLAEQLKQLKAQKAAAESRNLVLEKVFELRDLHTVHNSRLDVANATASSSATSTEEASCVDSSDIPRSLCLCKPPIHSPLDLETLQRAHQEQVAPMHKAHAPMRFTQSQLQHLEWGEFAKIWKEYISRMALCLVEANGDPSSAACKRIEGIMEELVTFYCHFASLQPKKADQFRWVKLDEDLTSTAAHAPPPHDLWQQIAKASNFDDQQQAQICGLRDFLATNLGKILKEREEISAQLASAVPSQAPPGSNSMMAMGHIQALQATEKLHKNLQQAQECLTHFQVAARQCMNPLQAALCCVQAYPWMPDIVALFTCAAEQRELSASDGGDHIAMSD